MMISAFALYLFAMVFILAGKRSLAFIFTALGLLLAAFIVWYHATSSLGINLS